MLNWLHLPGTTFAQAKPDLVLDFPPTRNWSHSLQRHRVLGQWHDQQCRPDPAERADDPDRPARDARERIVFSYEVAPPKRTLAPGESMTATSGHRSAEIRQVCRDRLETQLNPQVRFFPGLTACRAWNPC